MNRLLDRLPGTPMYLLWGEKVRAQRRGITRGATAASQGRAHSASLERGSGCPPRRASFGTKRARRVRHTLRAAALQQRAVGTVGTAVPGRGGPLDPLEGGSSLSAGPPHSPHLPLPPDARPAGPMVRARQGHPDTEALPRCAAYRHQQWALVSRAAAARRQREVAGQHARALRRTRGWRRRRLCRAGMCAGALPVGRRAALSGLLCPCALPAHRICKQASCRSPACWMQPSRRHARGGQLRAAALVGSAASGCACPARMTMFADTQLGRAGNSLHVRKSITSQACGTQLPMPREVVLFSLDSLTCCGLR